MRDKYRVVEIDQDPYQYGPSFNTFNEAYQYIQDLYTNEEQDELRPAIYIKDGESWTTEH